MEQNVIDWGVIRPKFINESVYFIRNEKDGFSSLRSKYLPRLEELFLDKLTNEILDLCNGKRTIREIVEEIINRHDYKEVNQVYEDVVRIMITEKS